MGDIKGSFLGVRVLGRKRGAPSNQDSRIASLDESRRKEQYKKKEEEITRVLKRSSQKFAGASMTV